MRILVDVCVSKAVERWLADQGLDVLAVRDIDPSMTDTDILALAASEQRLVITMDKDFGEMIVRSNQHHAGVLLLRLDDAGSSKKLAVIQQIFSVYGNALPGSYCIFQRDRLRVRRLS